MVPYIASKSRLFSDTNTDAAQAPGFSHGISGRSLREAEGGNAQRDSQLIAVFPLQASPQAQQALTIRPEQARHIYNACLGKAYATSIWRADLKTGNAPAP